MNLIYALEKLDISGPSIFLAGPTPRSKDIESWRPEAIRIFEELNFNGTLLIPENRDGSKLDFTKWKEQIEWEDNVLTASDCIMFWIPRNLDTMPGLTTNIEWGRWERSGKIVLGTPDGAAKVGYIRYYAQKLYIPYTYWLEETVKLAVKMADGRNNKRCI